MILETLNKRWTSGVLDWFFPLWTDFHKTPYFKFLLLPAILLLLFYYKRWSGLVFFFATAVAVGLTDGLVGKVIKPIFQRPRPPVAGVDVIMRAPHYGGFSFPSNHAANMFCLFAFVSFFFPRMRWPLFFIAFLTAYSRVYVGVHYPTDVLAGACIGIIFGGIFARLFRPIWENLLKRDFFRTKARGS